MAARLRDAQWDSTTASVAPVSPDSATRQLTAVVPTEGDLRTWLTVQERLRQVSLVRDVEVQALSRERAQVLVDYNGEVERLILTLAQYGLDMTDLGDGVWRIQLRRGTAPASPSAQPAAPTVNNQAIQAQPGANMPVAGGPTPGQGRVVTPR